MVLPSILTEDNDRGFEKDPYRLSESTINLLNTCERKFQLERMLTVSTPWDGSPAATRGKALGAGVQMYLLTGDMDRALAATWLAYFPELEDRPTVSIARTLNDLICAKDKLDAIRDRYEVAMFNGVPAVELGFRLNTDTDWYMVGYIDLVMYDKKEKMFVVFELKTTMYKLLDLRPAYKNSNQALGYSIVVDQIAGAEQNRFGVVYLIIRDRGTEIVPDIYIYEFPKTLTDRLRWFVTLGLDIERLERMRQLGIFPMRGSGCVSYNRPCQHFGTCHMSSLDANVRPRPTIERDYQFTYDLQTLIDSHLARVAADTAPMQEVTTEVEVQEEPSLENLGQLTLEEIDNETLI